MTTIGFIRHGVTDWNIEGRAQGRTDVPLNGVGRLQAASLADRMRGERWDMMVASDLSRARETAEAIRMRTGIPLTTDARLREKSCGQWEGTTLEQRIARWGERWVELDLGAEREETIAMRGVHAVRELVALHAGKRILIVSHGGLISCTLKALLPNHEFKRHLDNTSVTVLSLMEDRWECELYNCTKHIAVQFVDTGRALTP